MIPCSLGVSHRIWLDFCQRAEHCLARSFEQDPVTIRISDALEVHEIGGGDVGAVAEVDEVNEDFRLFSATTNDTGTMIK